MESKLIELLIWFPYPFETFMYILWYYRLPIFPIELKNEKSSAEPNSKASWSQLWNIYKYTIITVNSWLLVDILLFLLLCYGFYKCLDGKKKEKNWSKINCQSIPVGVIHETFDRDMSIHSTRQIFFFFGQFTILLIHESTMIFWICEWNKQI